MNSRVYFILPFYSLLLLSCVVDSDLPLPKTKPVFVVNGILNPDSVIKVNLSKTKNLIEQGKFELVQNALIKLYENDLLIDTLNEVSNGDYVSAHTPVESSRYKIVITGPDIEEAIEAEDVVPSRPSYSACFKRTVDIQFTNTFDVTVAINSLKTGSYQSFPWIEFISHDYKGTDTSKLLIQKFYIINSNSTYLDNFNSTFDNYTGYNDYKFYARVKESFINDPNTQVNILGGVTTQTSRLFQYERITNLTKDQKLILNVLNCSSSYDRYLKSTLENFLNTEFLGISSLFSGPVKIYSNVKNGTGIFAAYSPRSIQVDKFKCN
jgi:hypothetical protein